MFFFQRVIKITYIKIPTYLKKNPKWNIKAIVLKVISSFKIECQRFQVETEWYFLDWVSLDIYFLF